jgi:LysM repeat protein
MQKSQPIVILIIITMAIILAAGSFLALTYIQRRPDAPTGTLVTNVEGLDVTVRADPDKEVRVLNLGEIQVDSSAEEQAPAVPLPDGIDAQLDELPVTVEESPTPLPEPSPTSSPDPVIFEAYTVLASDTLYGIANRTDTSIALMARFGVSQDDLVPGNVIELPVGNPAYCPQFDRQPYAVGEGDTAFSVSRRFNIGVDELREINALDENYTVYAAVVICVPRS